VNAGEFPRSPVPVPDQRARLYEASSLMSIDNWREVGGSFERVIGHGSWNEPGLKDDL
jgi:hypothetical protein